jgi:altronate hydrolase
VKAVLVISAPDNVATALEPLDAGRRVAVNGTDVVLRESVGTGHKVAIKPIAAGAAVVKYGSAIGIATCDIAIGAHVHTHNVASTRGRGDLEHAPIASDVARLAEPPDERQAAEVNVEETPRLVGGLTRSGQAASGWGKP